MKYKTPLICLTLLLSGCDESFVDVVKAEPVLNYSALTYGEVLDHRKLCREVEWSSEKIRNTPTVHYRCQLVDTGDGIARKELISWERSRAMNGYVVIERILEQTHPDGSQETQTLDVGRLMYGAVYDLVSMEKYLTLHSAN